MLSDASDVCVESVEREGSIQVAEPAEMEGVNSSSLSDAALEVKSFLKFFNLF